MSRRRFLKKRYIIPLAIVGAPVAIGLFILVGGGAVMMLWNWLLPSLFAWPRITLLQGFGLLILCRILFGGFGGGGRSPKGMTPEEREIFQQRMRQRFCRPSEQRDEPEGDALRRSS